MKNRIFALILAGMFLTPSLSQASPLYLSGNIGSSIPFDSKYTTDGTSALISKNGMTLNSALTYGFAVGLHQQELRFEAEFRHQQNNVKTFYNNLYPALSGDKVSISSYLLNAYFDMNEDGKINPYVMTGLGISSIDASGPRPTGNTPGMDTANKSGFTWQIGIGAGFRASQHVVIDVGYRYLHPSSYSVADPSFGNIRISTARSNLMLGLQYHF
jgi:opacity protein-like surface antigen